MKLARAVDAGDGGGGFGEEGRAAAQVVFVVDADGRLPGDFGEEGQLLIVAGGGPVAAFHLYNGEEDAGLFEVGVAVADGAEQFDATHLEVLEIAAVVEVAHGIDLGIADADGDGMLAVGHGLNVAGEGWWGKSHPTGKVELNDLNIWAAWLDLLCCRREEMSQVPAGVRFGSF